MLAEETTAPATATAATSAAPSRSSASARIIAAGIVIAFCYWASTVLMTLLLAVLMAYLLDPVVSWLERIRLPRALGALLAVLSALLVLFVLVWSLAARVSQFGHEWPQYRAPLKAITLTVERKFASFEQQVNEIAPSMPRAPREIVAASHPIRDALLGKLTSLYTVFFAATFVPFLLFFMLAAKRQVWHATLQLFPATDRTRVSETLSQVSEVLRSYVVGSALVALILVLASWLFFAALGLDFSFLTGLVSGLCNMVPYLGVVIAWLPPLLIGLKERFSIGEYAGIFAMLTFLHILAANLLIPALVGWRVRLNALALTVALFFWGWLWGAMGLILAIPITAVIKVICDHIESCQPVGRWLGA